MILEAVPDTKKKITHTYTAHIFQLLFPLEMAEVQFRSKRLVPDVECC